MWRNRLDNKTIVKISLETIENTSWVCTRDAETKEILHIHPHKVNINKIN